MVRAHNPTITAMMTKMLPVLLLLFTALEVDVNLWGAHLLVFPLQHSEATVIDKARWQRRRHLDAATTTTAISSFIITIGNNNHDEPKEKTTDAVPFFSPIFRYRDGVLWTTVFYWCRRRRQKMAASTES